MVEIDAQDLKPYDLNRLIQKYLSSGEEVILKNPDAKHNIGIKLRGSGRVIIEGSTGYYTGGFMDGPEILIKGNTGWYLGDNMHSGRIVVERNSGSNVGPSMIGGEILIKGHSGSRIGLGMKGGLIVIKGKTGMLAGKMMLSGTIVLLDKVGDLVGESMYGGRIFLFEGPELGGNVKMVEPSVDEIMEIKKKLEILGIEKDLDGLKKVIPAGKQHKYVLFKPMHMR
jgi:glutamate synthase domain-containing protein 3